METDYNTLNDTISDAESDINTSDYQSETQNTADTYDELPEVLSVFTDSPEDNTAIMTAEEYDELPASAADDSESALLHDADEDYENWKRTPVNNGEWSDERGDSKWIPDSEVVQDLLARYDADGVEYHDSLPDFDQFAAFDVNLNDTEYSVKNAKQFDACNGAMSSFFSDLAEDIAGEDCDDPLSNEQYSEALKDVFHCDESDLEYIQDALDSGEKPDGYTWHHTEEEGRMQLIPTTIHDSARHRGGQAIWGGGNDNR